MEPTVKKFLPKTLSKLCIYTNSQLIWICLFDLKEERQAYDYQCCYICMKSVVWQLLKGTNILFIR